MWACDDIDFEEILVVICSARYVMWHGLGVVEILLSDPDYLRFSQAIVLLFVLTS